MPSSSAPKNTAPSLLALLAGLVGALQGGCMEPFDPPSKLGDWFQVLAISAEPRAILPGDAVELSALEYQPPSAPSAPEQIWMVCLPAEGEGPEACLGAALGEMGAALSVCPQRCAGSPDPTTCQDQCASEAFESILCPQDRSTRGCLAGYGPLARYELPKWFSQEKFFAFLLAAAGPDGLQGCFDKWAQQAQESGFPAPDEECTISFKRVTILDQGSQAVSNPTVTSLFVGNQEAGQDRLVLEADDMEADGKHILLHAESEAQDESYLSWFSDCGDLKHSRTFGSSGDNELELTADQTCSLFVVARDQNYGTGWSSVQIDPSQIDLQ